jgi:outer membrane receptor protein involved in Fe transport
MGVNYRLNLGESDVIIRQIEQSLYAFYLEDELRLRQNLALTLGFRYDGHSLFEDRITPRGNIMFSPRRKHFLRFSYAQAFRNPTFAETYLYIEGNAGPDDPSGLPPDISAFKVVGNQELEPEKITSYEAGYEALFANKIKCKIDLFYNHLTDFITLQMGPPPPPDDSMPPSPSDPISEENVVTFVNQGEASARGYELSLDLLAARWLRGWANYSYQYITEEDDDLHAPERDQTERMKAYPMHKFNVGFRFEPKRHFYANLMIHYVSQTEWDQNFLSQGQKLDSYTLFNLNVNYRIRPGKIESHLSAFNLFNDRHFEYPGNQGDQNSEPGFPSEGHLIGRRITFGISVNF